MIISSNDLYNFSNQRLPLNSSNKNKFSVSGIRDADETDETHKVNSLWRADKTRKLSELPKTEKIKEAAKSYSSMQAALLWKITDEQNKIKCFNEYKEKVSYYSGLLKGNETDNAIVITDKRFELSEKFSDTDIIGRDVIEGYLNKAATSLKRMAEPVDLNDKRFHEFRNITLRSVFRNSAADFAAVTGMTADCLNTEGDDSLLWHANDRTVENYVQKAEENIERLKARSNGLYQLMQDYKKSIGMDDFEDLFDMTDNYKMNALEEIRRQFLLTGKLTYTDKNFSLFYTMA